MEMKKRISQELGDKKPAEVMELILDSCLSADGEVEGLSEDFTKLEVLSLSNVGLTSLNKLPKLPKLRRLDLSDNSLSSGLESLLEKFPGLTYINLSGNKFKDLSAIKGLQKLPQLEALELDPEEEEEEEEEQEQWREKVFEILPQICFLNGFDQDHNQAPDHDEDEAGPHDDDDDDDDDEDDDEEDEGSDEGSDEDEVGLSYLMKEGIQDEEDDGDYVEEEEDEEEEDRDGVQGEKRKRDADDDEDDDE